MARLRKSDAGMTLIEVLVSMLIFSFGILGMVGLLARATKVSVDAEDRNRASLFANEVAAAMWAGRSITLPANVLGDFNARVADPTNGAGLPGGTLNIQPVPTALNGTTVVGATITVTWTPVGQASTPPISSSYQTQVVIQ